MSRAVEIIYPVPIQVTLDSFVESIAEENKGKFSGSGIDTDPKGNRSLVYEFSKRVEANRFVRDLKKVKKMKFKQWDREDA